MSDLRVNIGVTGAQQAAQALTSVEQKLNQTAKAGAKTSDALSRLPNASGAATQSLVNLSRVAQDAPFGFIGIANNINPLLESFQSLKAQTGTTSSALKALGASLVGPAGLGLAVGVVSSLLVVFGDKLFGAGRAAQKAKEEQTAYGKAVTDSISSIAEESAKIAVLVKIVQDETLAKAKRVEAINELKKVAPEYFNTLNAEKISIEALTGAYSLYLASVQRAIEAKALEAELIETIRKRIALERELDTGRFGPVLGKDGRVKEIRAFYDETGKANERQNELNKLLKIEGDLVQRVARLQKQVPSPQPIKLSGGKIEVSPDKLEVRDPREITFSRVSESDVEAPLELFSNLRNQTDAFNAIMGKPKEADGFAFPTEQEVKAIDSALRELTQTGLVVGQVFADAFGALTEALFTGQNAIKAFANAFIQSLTQVISKLIQTAILAAIVSAISGGGAAIGATNAAGQASNKFGDIFKFLLGFRGGRASGGGVVGGGSYLVGENGPEIFTPQVGGRIIPNGQLNSPLMTGGGMSGGRVVIRGRELRLLGIRTQNSQIRLSGR